MFYENRIISGSSGGGTGGAIPEGPLNFKGAWDANTNTPTLTSGVGNKGDVYIVSVAGNTNLDGISDWLVRDWAVFDGNVWLKIDNTEPVLSETSYGEMYFSGNSTPTVIGAPSSPVKVIGNFLSGDLKGFIFSGGTLTYTDAVTKIFSINVITSSAINLANDKIKFFIRKNSTNIDKGSPTIDTRNVSPSFIEISLGAFVSVAQNDTLELWVQNNTSSEDITVESVNFRVGAPGISGGASSSSGNLFTQTQPEVKVENSSLEETLKGTGTGSMLFPANSLKVGDSFNFILAGNIQTNGTSQTINFKIADDFRVFLNTGSFQLLSQAGLTSYILTATITVMAIGTSGLIHTILHLPKITSNINDSVVLGTYTVNTTVNNDLDVTVQWGAASANNIITSQLISFSKI